ncbi:hypothetical protein SAMN05216404_110124 [Nitrosospira multiformis]|uniref:Uncharacterized protein n=1 Tax=Nitrosospira multiformis TaxID=1231 RepID=A0A1H8LJ69_9PROT|nr:hypothetical protein [Nitrosospira multiformis]SEO05210.1 hypothetical protein SAMN05216404_110124 [Nitrosospira multiformis]
MEVAGRKDRQQGIAVPEMHKPTGRSLLDKDPLARVFVYPPPAFYTWIQGMKIFRAATRLNFTGTVVSACMSLIDLL